MASIVIASVPIVMAACRILRSGHRPGRAEAILIATGMVFLFAARAGAADVEERRLSMVLDVAPDLNPIIEVSGVLIRIEETTPSTIAGDGDSWTPSRGVLAVTGGDVPTWIDARMSVRFDRPGGQEIVGGELRLRGRLHPHGPETNPGITSRYRGSGRVPATLVVPHPGLIEVMQAPDADADHVISEIRSAWRSSIGRLERRMTARDPALASGVLTALLTGDRRDLTTDFRMAAMRSGLAHLLAISGLHLGVIGMIVGTCSFSLVGRTSRLIGFLPIIAVFIFGMVVVPGPGVQRAVLMAVGFGVLQIAGRRVRGRPLMFLALALMCWWEPLWPRSVGFQLTAIATMAIVCSLSASRQRWFGTLNRTGSSRLSILRDRIGMAASAGIVAWTSTMPILLANFGAASLVSVPATMIAGSMLGPVLGIGSVLGVIESLAPGFLGDDALQMIDIPLSSFCRFLTGVSSISSPASFTTSSAGLLLSVPMAAVLSIVPSCPRPLARWSCLLIVLVTGAFCFGTRNTMTDPGVRMIDVGNGSTIVVRTDRKAMLYDAGSSSVTESGSRITIPALRRIGIRELEAIVISHANADHFDAVSEIIDVMPVGRLITTESVVAEARSGRRQRLSDLLSKVHARRIPIDTVSRGDRFAIGRIECRVLHPMSGELNRTTNDASLVLAVDVSGRHDDRKIDLLLTGDIQDEGIARVMNRERGLGVSVLELPHHGSWRPITAEMIRNLDPEVVIQSTGPRRWRHDRFGEACEGRRRLVTARDGSFVVDLPVD